MATNARDASICTVGRGTDESADRKQRPEVESIEDLVAVTSEIVTFLVGNKFIFYYGSYCDRNF